MARRATRPLLEDMRAYAAEAVGFLGDRTGDALAQDRLRLLALSRAAEIEFGAAIAMRNRLIHGYGSLSAAILSETVRTDFPRLIAAIDAALSTPLPDEAGA